MNRLADELRAIPREAYLMKRVPQDTHHTDLPESDLCFQVQGSVDENRMESPVTTQAVASL